MRALAGVLDCQSTCGRYTNAYLLKLGKEELLGFTTSLRLVVPRTEAENIRYSHCIMHSPGELGQRLLEVVHLEVLDDRLDEIGGVTRRRVRCR